MLDSDDIDGRVIKRNLSSNYPDNYQSRNSLAVSKNTSINLSEAKERTDVAIGLRRIVLITLLASAFFFNVDSGIFAPALLKIEADLEVSEKGIAILNSVSYILSGALPMFTGMVMMYFEARTVLVCCALLNSFGTFLFIGTKNYHLLVVGRAMTGICQAFISTYAPVWVNEFSPKVSKTTWMGYISGCGIFGGVMGAVVGSIAADNEQLGISTWFNWKTTLLFPATAFTKIALTFFCMSNLVLDTQAREKQEMARLRNNNNEINEIN